SASRQIDEAPSGAGPTLPRLFALEDSYARALSAAHLLAAMLMSCLSLENAFEQGKAGPVQRIMLIRPPSWGATAAGGVAGAATISGSPPGGFRDGSFSQCSKMTALRASVPSPAASAGTGGAAILAAFCRKASPSGAGCLGLTGLLYFCHPRPVNGYLFGRCH